MAVVIKEKKDKGVVLTDFIFLELSDPIPQQEASDVLAKGMTKALAVKSGKQSERDVDRIYGKVLRKFSQFAASSKTIKQRYMILWPENYSAVLEAKISEKHRFVKHAIDFPMFEDLAKEHKNPEGAGLSERMALYQHYAEKYIGHLYDGETEAPDQIIHITSSGYLNPNPVDKLVEEKGWYNTYVINFYHRACNSSIPAMQMANAYLRSSLSAAESGTVEKRMDVVHSEMFSVHLRIDDDDPVNIALMTTYSDSFMKYSLKPFDSLREKGEGCLKVLAFKNMMIPGSSSVATWKVADTAFNLDINPFKYINLIRKYVGQFVVSFLHDEGFDFKAVKDKLLYVIQASGPVDLEAVARQLKLDDDQVFNTRSVLFENGYLSSTAIPYMCKQIAESDEVVPGQKILCLGHAQGIYLSAMLLEKA